MWGATKSLTWASTRASTGSVPRRGGDLLRHVHDRAVGDLEQQVRVDAQDQDQGQHRRPGHPLGAVDVVEVRVVDELVLDGDEGRALVDRKSVVRGKRVSEGVDL